jgi:flavin reductase (DIM6/NTAB) family NADH-FMN oxidoreductase RutF
VNSDTQALRQAFGRFATGVTVITCRKADGEPVGLTANSFSSLSLEPALVLWSLRISSPSRVHFEKAKHFAVNVLQREDLELSRRFASSRTDRFEPERWEGADTHAPLLLGALARFECAAHSVQEVGDHLLFIGQVLSFQQHAGQPLLFSAGHYRELGAAL